MKWVMNGVGIILTLIGLVWFLQGMNVLRSTVMSGQSQWVVIGLILAIVGIGVLVWTNRGRIKSQAPR